MHEATCALSKSVHALITRETAVSRLFYDTSNGSHGSVMSVLAVCEPQLSTRL